MTLKNGWKWSFSYEMKTSIHLSRWEKWICSAQSLKEKRLLCESVFILSERWTLILKMVKREVFLIKPKHHYHLPERKKCVYSAQSWKKRRLLCEFVILQIDERILILKMVAREVFLMKPKHEYHLYQWGECV